MTTEQRLRDCATQGAWPTWHVTSRELMESDALRLEMLDLQRLGYITWHQTSTINPLLIVDVTQAGKAHYFSLVHGTQP